MALFLPYLSKVEEKHGITAIAIDEDKNSQVAVKWAVENYSYNKSHHFILVHVRTKIFNPQDFDAVPKEGRPPTQQELQLFLPYRGFCVRKGVELKEVVIHDIDIARALADYIGDNCIDNIILGASTRNPLTRKFRNLDIPSGLLKLAPKSCGVYVISEGKIQSRSRLQKPTSAASSPRKPEIPTSNAATPKAPSNAYLYFYYSEATKSPGSSNLQSMAPCEERTFSYQTLITSMDGQALDVSKGDINVVEAEMRRLKLELKQSMEMYNSVCKEAVLARHLASQLQHLHTLKARKLEEAKLAEEAALSLAEMEKQKANTAIEAAKMAQRLAQMESQKRQAAEKRAIQERKKAIKCLEQNSVLYRKYTIEEIEVATNYFERSKKIGEGGYGPVFKATLDHTPVAIKVLRPDLSQGQRQFHKEVQVLSNMRHPHMVILLGACPEYGCLVYEFMERGSLEDCLFRKGNSPPIPWRKRFGIASEISTALLFLHETKPEPICKAGNISQYCQTEAAGTFCYIDPEYQQTGLLGVKSDIYSLGIILLQLITAKKPMGLSHQVEQAIEAGTFPDILDQTQTDWPVEEALSLAKLALKCCELRKKDRPDLASVVLPELNRLRDLALADEADESQMILPLTHPYVSVSQGKCHTSQIYAKGGWHQRHISKFWSFKSKDASSNRKSRIFQPQKGNGTWKKNQTRKTSMVAAGRHLQAVLLILTFRSKD
ncbi:PROTEIN KINASE SUPERFAMILY PROTEIN [Salix viminalis]|uniref:RING-type E3 ubiquitin transferase n=1 Tax=Salix viminalis TaxID=40686 RepID=A0A9Q0TPA7_SALVM|nr:PROTEIN KINASE SUPERFAMILY PROTEIN [Salix viminalis]